MRTMQGSITWLAELTRLCVYEDQDPGKAKGTRSSRPRSAWAGPPRTAPPPRELPGQLTGCVPSVVADRLWTVRGGDLDWGQSPPPGQHAGLARDPYTTRRA